MASREYEKDGSARSSPVARRRLHSNADADADDNDDAGGSTTEEYLADQLVHVRERAQQFLERELLFGVNFDRWVAREQVLRLALSPSADREHRAAVFVSVRSSSIVLIGMILALCTIGCTIAGSLLWRCTDEERIEYGLVDMHSDKALKFLATPLCADLQGLLYP